MFLASGKVSYIQGDTIVNEHPTYTAWSQGHETNPCEGANATVSLPLTALDNTQSDDAPTLRRRVMRIASENVDTSAEERLANLVDDP